MENIGSTIRNAGIKNNDLSAKLTAIMKADSLQIIRDSASLANTISEEMKNVRKEAIDINSEVYKLKLKLENLEPDWDSKFGLAEENISLSLRNIKATNTSLIEAESLILKDHEKFKVSNDTLSMKMQELRDKIARAKHAAEGVSSIFI